MSYKTPKELLCEECTSEKEVMIDRSVEGVIIRVGDSIQTYRPAYRSRLCYYHNKKRIGRFGGKLLNR